MQSAEEDKFAPNTIQTSERPFVCGECPKEFTTYPQLKYHIRVHFKEWKYACPECTMKFRCSVVLSDHMLNHQGELRFGCERRFGCEKCDNSFSSLSQLSLHGNVHDDNHPHACVICDKRSARNLQEFIHAVCGYYKCTVCDKWFDNKDSLQSHEHEHERSHIDPAPVTCLACGKSFSNNYQLSSHKLRVHSTGGLPYACKVCDKTFNILHMLLSHSIVHSDERPYACDQCGQRFKRAGHLRVHLQYHIRWNDAAHCSPVFSDCPVNICSECFELFSNRDELLNHCCSTHVFRCGICDESFHTRDATKSCFMRHL